MRRAVPALLIGAVACASHALDEGLALYAEGRFAEARDRTRERLAHGGLDGEARVEPLALVALCDAQLGDARSPALDEAARELGRIQNPVGRTRLMNIARAVFHETEAGRALDGVDDAGSRHATMLARAASRELTQALALYEEARAQAANDRETRFLRYRWARAELLKARAHARSDEPDLARLSLNLAHDAVDAELAAASPFAAELAELKRALQEEARRP